MAVCANSFVYTYNVKLLVDLLLIIHNSQIPTLDLNHTEAPISDVDWVQYRFHS